MKKSVKKAPVKKPAKPAPIASKPSKPIARGGLAADAMRMKAEADCKKHNASKKPEKHAVPTVPHPVDDEELKRHEAYLDKRQAIDSANIQPVHETTHPEGVDFHSGKQKLLVGDIVELSGVEYFVEMVNESRARVVPTSVQNVQYTTNSGKNIEFKTAARGMDISPATEVNVKQRLGPDGLKLFLEEKGLARESLKGTAAKAKRDPNQIVRMGKVVLDLNGVSPVKGTFDMTYKRPKGVPEDMWPTNPGSIVCHQMLMAKRYTMAEIVATVMSTKDNPMWGMEDAFELATDWLKDLGSKAAVK